MLSCCDACGCERPARAQVSRRSDYATRGGSESTPIHRQRDFISYPTNCVVGTIADPTQARTAIKTLLQSGVDPEQIDILHEETAMHRLDPDGSEHGFLAPVQRTMTRNTPVVEE